MYRLLKVLTGRIPVTVLLILLQLLVIFSWVYRITTSFSLLYAERIFAIILTVHILNKNEESAYKLAWAVSILALPVLGGVLYLLFGGRKMPKELRNGTIIANQRMDHLLDDNGEAVKLIRAEDSDVRKMFHYGTLSGFPVYSHTDAVYFAEGESFFKALREELEKAEHFIFLEYFIISQGEIWDSIQEILIRKRQAGVDVKIIYDDVGTTPVLPAKNIRLLKEAGIEVYAFNRMRPVLMVRMNNRDHRKIAVIDNRVGFTGGMNIGDEYANRRERFGIWRDSAIMIKGEAVWSLTVMFLGIYSWLREESIEVDYERYRLKSDVQGYHGLFQPYSDTPTDDNDTGISIHLNMISLAKRYIYIDTPYLLVNDTIQKALCMAAQNGVDVRILVPHVPDKRIVYGITCSNYEVLLKSGVRIYEYTPGFNHTKNFVADDRLAVVGTVNMDYRSYYFHFEDGIVIYDSPEIIRMRDDFLHTLEGSEEKRLEDCRKVPALLRLVRGITRLLAPLL